MSGLRVGAAMVDITPDWPLPLAGFAVRDSLSQGSGTPLHVRVAVFEHGDTRAVVVSADLIWWASDDVERIRREISDITGAPASSVLLSATHSHSGPQTSSRALGIGEPDPRYLTLLDERVRQAATGAVERLDPVLAQRFTGAHDLAFNRRYRFNPDGPVDRTLTVIRYDRADGMPAALLVHYTCHPTISQEHLASGEYCGAAMNALEERLGAPALFLQGCCGDINPDVNRDGVQARGDESVIVREGELLAEAVMTTMTGSGEELSPVDLTARTVTVDLPFAHVPTAEDLRTGASEPGWAGVWKQRLLDHPEWVTPAIPLTMQRLDLARGFSLLAMNGEICVEYGLHMRELSGGAVLPLGYSNGMTGYVPTQRIIEEGGYEAGESIPWFALPAPFAPEVEPILRNALSELIATRETPQEQN